MKKLLTINKATPSHRIARFMLIQSIINSACYTAMGNPADQELRDEVGNDAIVAVLLQAATMLSAFLDVDTGKETDPIAIGNHLIDVANMWIDKQW